MSLEEEKSDRTKLGKEGDMTDKQSERREVFYIKVNGTEIAVPSKELSALKILEFAKRAGAMPGEPGDYILQGDRDKYQGNDTVDLENDNQFITIPVKPTPVA